MPESWRLTGGKGSFQRRLNFTLRWAPGLNPGLSLEVKHSGYEIITVTNHPCQIFKLR